MPTEDLVLGICLEGDGGLARLLQDDILIVLKVALCDVLCRLYYFLHRILTGPEPGSYKMYQAYFYPLHLR